MAAYLEPETAAARLFSEHGVETTLTTGDLELASNEIDAGSPFIGSRYDPDQERAFPRSLDYNGNRVTSPTVPTEVLNATVCIAYAIKRGEFSGLNSESVLDKSLSFSRPRVSPWVMRAALYMQRWQRTTGSAR